MRLVLWVILVSLTGAMQAGRAGPQPPDGTWRIVCIGDSITQADSAHRSYRYELWKRLVDEGIPFDLVGSMNNNFSGNPSWPTYQGLSFDRDHDGHAAWDTEDILYGYVCNENICPGVPGGWLSLWLGGYTPDIALIHLGHNDLFRGWPSSRSSDNLSTIIDQLRGDNPNVVILLSKIINSILLDEVAINNSIASLAASKSTMQSPVILVDNYAGFDVSDLQSDGIHPNASGELKIATKFGDALMEYLNANCPPVIDAGADQVITWPILTATLNGTATDDGKPETPGQLSYLWTWVAGPAPAAVTEPQSLSTDITLPMAGAYTFRLEVSDGEFERVDWVTVQVDDGGNCEARPIIVASEQGWTFFEAEFYSSLHAGTAQGANHRWNGEDHYHGTSGEIVMQATPVDELNMGTNLVGPRIDYSISFPTNGIWYVWLRMYSPGPRVNSVHVGLNGSAVSIDGHGVSDEVNFDQWVWRGETSYDGHRVAIDVPGRGIHTLNVWMREGGVVFDKVMLTQDEFAVAEDSLIPTQRVFGTYCDLDGDALPDDWETMMFGDTLPLPGGDQDGDLLTNGDEFIAGTSANDPMDFTMITTEADGMGGIRLAMPTVTGRVYDVQFTEDLYAMPPVWQTLSADLPGVGGMSYLVHSNAPSSAVYRYLLRLP